MFRHRLQLRRWAAQVLLVWLFGIGAAFANACSGTGVAESSGDRSGHAVAAQAIDSAAVASPNDADHGPQQVPHHCGVDPDGTPAKTNCQDFCDKSTISIPTLKLALDHADSVALPAAAVAIGLPVWGRAPVQPLLPRRDGVAAPPITIAFLRLVL